MNYEIKSGKALKAVEDTQQILLRYLLIDSMDYHNVVKELINKIKSLVSADDTKLNSKLNSIKQRFNKIIEFQKGKYKLQENGCNDTFITKSKIIKCAIETDYPDSQKIHNLVDKVW